MATEGEPRFLPISFYDGNCELNIDHIKIHSSLDYKAFQSLVSQKIGISTNQMSMYFVDINNTPKRKTFITGKASFNLILQEKHCTLLVVLKRSKKHRRQKSQLTNNIPHANANAPLVPHNLNLLSRSVPGFVVCPVVPYYYDQIAAQELLNYNNRVRNLNNYYYPVIEESYCDECMDARRQGKAVQFHLCANDAVVAGWFRTPAGAIVRRSSCKSFC